MNKPFFYDLIIWVVLILNMQYLGLYLFYLFLNMGFNFIQLIRLFSCNCEINAVFIFCQIHSKLKMLSQYSRPMRMFEVRI